MKQVNPLVRKELYHIFRHSRPLFILLCMPVAQIILFGFALTNEVKNAGIAVLDLSSDISTHAITEELNSSRYFDLEKNLHSYRDIEKTFRKGEIKLVVVFPSNFHNDLYHFNKAQVQLVADASDPNTANALTNYASAVIFDYQQRITSERKLPYS